MSDVRPTYTGETRFPLIFQNLHRYAFYVAVVFIVVLPTMRSGVPVPGRPLGIGVGTLVMWLNVVFLAGYTFSCHSCRHLCGGSPTSSRRRRPATRCGRSSPGSTSGIPFAWLSLFSVGLTDLYIRLVSMGVIRTSASSSDERGHGSEA